MAITRGNITSGSRSTSGTDASVSNHTVESDDTLLVVTTMFEAGETVSGTPQWSGNGTPQNLTLVDATTSSGSNNDMALATYALVNPTAETNGTVTVTHTSNDNYITVAVNYKGTNTSSVANAIQFIQEDVNDSATNSTVFSSGGTSGNTLYAAGSFKGDDGNDDSPTSITVPTNFSALFANALRSGTSSSLDISGYVCDYIGGAPSACSWTWDVTDENAGHYLEIVPGSADRVVDDFPTPDEIELTGHIPLTIHPRKEEPGDQSLSITGYIPSANVGSSVEVNSSTLTLTGYLEYNYGGPGLRLIGFEPSLSIEAAAGPGDITEEPGAGSLALTGEIPTVATTAHHWIDVDSGSLTLTGEIPVVVVSLSAYPILGAVDITGEIPLMVQTFNHIRAPPLGAVVLTGEVPTVQRTENHFPLPGTGSLALTGQAPTLDQTENHFVDPSVGALALTGYIPAAGQFLVEAPDTGSIALTGYAPTIEFSWTVYPGAGSTSLTGEIPSLAVAGSGIAPDAGALVFTGYVPIASEAATVEVSPGSLELTTYLEYSYGGPGLRLIGYEPYLTAGGHNPKPSTGSAALSGQAPIITVNHIVEPAEDTLVITGEIPDKSLSSDVTAAINFTSALDITGLAPTIDRSVDTVSPEPGSLTLTGYDLALFTTEPHSINPGTGSLSLTGYLEYNYGGPGLRVIGYEPTITTTTTPDTSFTIEPGVVNLLVETHAPSIEIIIDGGFEQLILTGYAPTISESTDHTPVPGAGNLTLSGFSPTPQLGTPPNINIPVQTGSLSLTGEAPTISFSWTVYPGTGEVNLTGYGFTFDTLLTIQIPAVPELSITSYAPRVDKNIDAGELTLVGQQPKLTILGDLPVPVGSLSCTGHAPFAFRRSGGGTSKEELRELGAKRKKEQDLRKETLKRVEEHKEELAEKIFGEEPSVIKEILETGKGEVSGIEVEIEPLQPPQFPIDELAPQLEQIKDGMDREIASLIRAQEEAKFKRELAEFQLKVQRMEEELIAFLILAMDD